MVGDFGEELAECLHSRTALQVFGKNEVDNLLCLIIRRSKPRQLCSILHRCTIGICKTIQLFKNVLNSRLREIIDLRYCSQPLRRDNRSEMEHLERVKRIHNNILEVRYVLVFLDNLFLLCALACISNTFEQHINVLQGRLLSIRYVLNLHFSALETESHDYSPSPTQRPFIYLSPPSPPSQFP